MTILEIIIYETIKRGFLYCSNLILFNISGLTKLKFKSVGHASDKAY